MSGVASAVAPPSLVGRWSLRRRVIDRVVGTAGEVDGTLTLAPMPGGVRWFEEGTLHWGGHDYAVHRELHLVAPAAGAGGWQVRFADGRDFHPWTPGEVVRHPCRADEYCGLVVVDRSALRLRVLWDVTGPAKQQRIYSHCIRLTPR